VAPPSAERSSPIRSEAKERRQHQEPDTQEHKHGGPWNKPRLGEEEIVRGHRVDVGARLSVAVRRG